MAKLSGLEALIEARRAAPLQVGIRPDAF